MLEVEKVVTGGKEPAILYIRWLDYDPFMKLNFEAHFFHIIDQIKSSHIKKLVLDSSNRQHDPPEDDFREILELFLSGLSDTELEKFARVCSPDPETNFRFQHYLNEIKEDLGITFQIQNFNHSQGAMKWLGQET